MAYDEVLADRIRDAFMHFPSIIHSNITEKRMFGGLSFLFHGKMTIGILNNLLTARILAPKMDAVLQIEGVSPMDFTKRPLKEFVYVEASLFETDEQLLEWIALGLEHAKSKL